MKEIKNTTVYSKNNVKDFLEVYYFDRIKGIRAILNIFIIIMVITFFIKEDRTTLDIMTFLFSLFGAIEINTSMLPRLNIYKLTKEKDSIININVKYLFKENTFILNNEENIEYKSLKKVIETNMAYYLYINKGRALIVDKKLLKEKDINTLTEIFKEQVSTYIYKNVW